MKFRFSFAHGFVCRVTRRFAGAAAICALLCPLSTPAFAASNSAASQLAIQWLESQQDASDGSWGANDNVRFLQTSEAVIALGALNRQSAAYYKGVAWLSNHASTNVDFTVRRVLALAAANQSVSADLQLLQNAQNLTAGNNGWGLSSTYQGCPLDTALTLQALNQQGVTTNVSQAVTYLTGAQLAGGDTGWALGKETASDPTTTAHVVIALIPQKALNTSVPTAITNGLAALNAKVTSASPVSQIALAIVANLRNDPKSSQATTLLNALLAQQTADGSWANDPYATALAMRALAAGAAKDLAAQKQVVSVPDNALRGALNNALGQGALDAVTVGQIQQLTTLNASGLGISDLTGLQVATRLTYLDLSNNNISSFDPVASLTATIIETGNPGYVPPVVTGDVPTLPEWGALLLAGLLASQIARSKQQA